jgi:hypothetical protein
VEESGTRWRMKSEIKVMRDGRVILKGTAYSKMKLALRKLAEDRCERCGKYTMQGDVEHKAGRGGGKRDDRIFVDGKRNLEYLCRQCHTGRHIPDKVLPAKVSDSELMDILGVK